MMRSLGRRGFTLIETIVTLAILSILVGFITPQVVTLIDKAKLSTDHTNVRELNSATSIYRVLNTSTDPFLDESKSDAELMQILVDAQHIRALISPRSTDAEYIFDKDLQRWLLSIDSFIIPPIIYLLTPSDYTTGWAAHYLQSYTNTTELNIQIPEGIRTIHGGSSDAAFLNRGLDSVLLPNSLQSINAHAFNGNNLNEIIIPDNVNFIGTYAFYANPITTITINREPGQIVIQNRVFGTGYTESNVITEAFKSAFTAGGSGTYVLDGTTWIKID